MGIYYSERRLLRKAELPIRRPPYGSGKLTFFFLFLLLFEYSERRVVAHATNPRERCAVMQIKSVTRGQDRTRNLRAIEKSMSLDHVHLHGVCCNGNR